MATVILLGAWLADGRYRKLPCVLTGMRHFTA